MKKGVFLIVLSLLVAGVSTAKSEPPKRMPLSPGFNPGELPELLEVCEKMYDPKTIQSFDYERMGVTIPLIPNQAYYRKFPNDPKKFNVWENHSIYPYYWLVTNVESDGNP